MDIKQIKKKALETGIKDFYNHIRNYYLEKNGFKKEEINADKDTLDHLVNQVSEMFNIGKEKLWESKYFHLNFRITEIEELSKLGIEEKLISNAKDSVEKGRDMSILPLNALIGKDTIKKFIPYIPELYEQKKKHSHDPYSIFIKESKIWAIDGKKKLLGSRKFDYAVLANITSDCPTGCAGCYKGSITRLNELALSEIDPKYKEVKEQLAQREEEAIEQAKLLTKWLNKHKEVNTVIMSGGEPLLYSADTIGKILNEYSKAKHIKIVRVCTSSVYQGSFFNITDELIDNFKKFSKENNRGKKKKQLYINAHITDENQLSTPEAQVLTEKLKDAGLSIHLQMPIMQGINFYRDDVKKSAEKLRKICTTAYENGIIPYKAIVDMHSPEHPEITVPIEKVSEAITFLDSHFDTSDMNRWQAYNILHEQGNAYITAKPHFVAEKDIDKDKVTYYIPKIDANGEIIVHTYEEPLLEGINNKDSLSKINDQRILSKIGEVKEAYKKLKNQEIDAKEFYKVSGIKFSINKPLIINK